MQENEYLYLKYKDEYQNALQLIESISEEKNRLYKILLYAKKKPVWFITNSNLDDETLLKLIDNDMDNYDDMIQFDGNNNKHNDSSTNYINADDNQRIGNESISIEEHDKIRDELLLTKDHKNNLENECSALRIIQSQFRILKEDYERINEINNNLNDTITQLKQENNVMVSQIMKITKDKEDTYQAMNILREQFNISEKEKTHIKIRNSHHFSKFKFLEKELTKSNNKHQSLNNNIKDLSDKLQQEYENQQIMQQNYEEIIEELENRIINIENEKKRVVKNSMAVFIESTAKQMNNLSLTYNSNKDKIEIKYDDEIIGEVQNTHPHDNKCQDKAKTENKAIENKSPLNVSKESTLCRFKQLSCYEQIKQNNSTHSNSKQLSSNKNYSLKKLFSNNNYSISNKKSFESTSFFDDKDKENSFNLNQITLASITKRQQSIIIDKPSTHNMNKKITSFNTETNLTHCILKANINKEVLAFTNNNIKSEQQIKKFDSLIICILEQLTIIHKKITKVKCLYSIETNSYFYNGTMRFPIMIKQNNLEEGKENSNKEIRELKSFLDYTDDTYYSEDMIMDTMNKNKNINDDYNNMITKKTGKEGKCNGCVVF